VVLKEGQELLVVSSTIYRPYQHLDALRALGRYGVTIETVGVPQPRAAAPGTRPRPTSKNCAAPSARPTPSYSQLGRERATHDAVRRFRVRLSTSSTRW
jgi:hypothetical protein